MSTPQKAVNQFPSNSYQGQNNNALVSLGTPSNLFMPTTVTQMNATPLASNNLLIQLVQT